MKGTFEGAISEENLRRAWRWIKSNADAAYKGYFRDLYSVYAIAEDALLVDLRDRLRRGIYQPTSSCKLLLPKPSGVLRPYTLLTIDDQIAYQAAVNIIAERLFPRVRRRYLTEVFGHLYAGRSSIWFYRKWSAGYAKFNEAIRAAFEQGFTFSASFDLTACYDSLDHGVLRQLLLRLGCQPLLVENLTKWLSVWTATERGLYHHHGIPQGPLASGLLSEVVLRHFDEHRRAENKVRYFRYVDDIRLLGKSEDDLRRLLVRLDALSKDVGLFPQASKISIHRITNIQDELKTVSHPTETSVARKSVRQDRLKKRLVALSPRFEVSDPTRFKYLLRFAVPDARTSLRLWRIYQKHPEYYRSLADYLKRSPRLPRSTAAKLVKEVTKRPLYDSVLAAFVDAANGRVSGADASRLDRQVKTLWKPRTLQADAAVALGRWGLARGALTSGQLAFACRRLKSWWARSQLVLALNPRVVGRSVLEAVTNEGLRDLAPDAAIAAASTAIAHGVPIRRPVREINRSALQVLKAAGLLNRPVPAVCGIEVSLERMVGKTPAVKWRVVFGSDYSAAERQAVTCAGRIGVDATGWINAMDVFVDQLLDRLHKHDTSLGGYQLGRPGSVLNKPTGRLATKYAAVYELADSVHAKRLGSDLSHPKVGATGRPTGPVKYSYIRKARRLLRAALAELAVKW